MATLHTVNKSPFERSTLVSCFNHTVSGDKILMIEDGVISARKGSAFEELVKSAQANCALYVLAPDMAARGIAEGDLVDGVIAVDYGVFADMLRYWIILIEKIERTSQCMQEIIRHAPCMTALAKDNPLNTEILGPFAYAQRNVPHIFVTTGKEPKIRRL